MYYVYVLENINHDRLYIGSSADPEKRLKAHNAGRVTSTKRYRPWKRIFLEERSDRKTAEAKERYFKSGWGRRWLAKNVLLKNQQN
jgi:putative endonuclease